MMDEPARRAYLHALGVDLWVRRTRNERECGAGPRGVAAARNAEEPGSAQGDPSAADVAAMSWDALRGAVRECRACLLCETRTQTVFGVGDQAADLLIIGEAPGQEEDRQGEPFVGRAGQLLDRMLAAIGLDRQRVFIANILKCRPPGNRDPRPEEVLSCEAFLRRQIELIGPRLILAAGRVSAQSLLRTDASVGRLRGRWFELGETGVPLRVTYHPAYLLRSPEQKAKAWDDLIEVARRLDTAR
jgi:DNA polymerase